MDVASGLCQSRVNWVIILLLTIFLLAGCNLMAQPQSATPTSAPIYLTLRDRILTTDPREIGLSSTEGGPETWAVVMDMGWPDATVTLVGVGDGTTSLYFSNEIGRASCRERV